MRSEKQFNKAMLAAVEREQRLLAEELHNTVCQSLAGISFLVKILQRRIEKGCTIKVAELNNIGGYLDDAIDHARAPLHLQALLFEEAGLVKAIRELCRLTSKRVRCDFETEGILKLKDPQVAYVFYRITRETIEKTLSLGHVKAIAVSLLRKKSVLVLEIRSKRKIPPGSNPVLPEIDFLERYADAVGIRLSSRKNSSVAALRCAYSLDKETLHALGRLSGSRSVRRRGRKSSRLAASRPDR